MNSSVNGLKYCIIYIKSYIFLMKFLIFPKHLKFIKKSRLIDQNSFQL